MPFAHGAGNPWRGRLFLANPAATALVHGTVVGMACGTMGSDLPAATPWALCTGRGAIRLSPPAAPREPGTTHPKCRDVRAA